MPRVMKQERAEVTDQATPDVSRNGSHTVAIELPLGAPVPTAFPIHLDLRLDSRKGEILRRLAAALDKQQATLANGRRVVGSSAAVQWLLEQIAVAETA